MVKELLKERRSKNWAVVPGMSLSKLRWKTFCKLSRDLMALDREQCSLVTWLLTSLRTLKWLLNIAGFSGNMKCKKCEQEEECSTMYSVSNTQHWLSMV